MGKRTAQQVGPRSAVGRAPDSYVRSWVRYLVWPHTFVSPSADSREAVVSYWRKYVQEVLVNRLGGLSLPRKSVIRLTDSPDLTLDVCRGSKSTTTTTAQQDTMIDITSDSQGNSNFPYRWSLASLTFNNYFYLFLYIYIYNENNHK